MKIVIWIPFHNNRHTTNKNNSSTTNNKNNKAASSQDGIYFVDATRLAGVPDKIPNTAYTYEKPVKLMK